MNPEAIIFILITRVGVFVFVVFLSFLFNLPFLIALLFNIIFFLLAPHHITL